MSRQLVHSLEMGTYRLALVAYLYADGIMCLRCAEGKPEWQQSLWVFGGLFAWVCGVVFVVREARRSFLERRNWKDG